MSMKMVKGNIIVKRVDGAGRVQIPAEWRKDWGDRVILFRMDDGSVLIRPLRKKISLCDLFDSIEMDISPEDFKDVHKLRRRLHEEIPGL